MWKKMLYVSLAAGLLILAGCSNSEPEIEKINVSELSVPADFNYEMSGSVAFNIYGAYRLPVKIKSESGNVLFSAQMNPDTGIQTRLLLPKTIKKVVIAYQTHEVTLNVTGDEVNYDFTAQR